MTGRPPLIQAARFSPDGTRLLTGSLAGVLADWDVPSGRRRQVLLDPKGIEDQDREWQFHDAGNKDAEPPFYLVRLSEDMRGSSINWIAWYPDGSRFVVAAGNGFVVAWNADWGEIHSWQAHDTSTVVVEVSPDGHWLATGCAETGATTLRVWKTAENWGAPVEAFSSDRMIGGVFSLAFSPDSRFLASGGWGFSGYSAPMIYELETGERVNTLLWDASRAIRYSPDGTLLATGDEFGKVSIWNLEQRARIVEKNDAHGRIVSLAEFSPDGRLLLSGSCDGGLKIWDVPSGDLRDEHHYDGMVLSCRFSEDGTLLVAVAPQGSNEPEIHRVRWK